MSFAEAVVSFRHAVRPVPASAAFGLATAWPGPGQASVVMPVPVDAITGRSNAPASLAVLLADSASGAALHSDGHTRSNITLSIHIDVLDRFPMTGHLRCQTRLVCSTAEGRHLIEGVITDDHDRRVARSTSWWLRGRSDPPPASTADFAFDAEAAHEAGSLASRFGIEYGAGPGRATLRARRLDGYLNRRRTLHGGVAGMLAEIAVEKSLADAGRVLDRTLSLSVTYLARTGIDGAPVDVEASVVGAGARFGILEARVLAADGTPAVLATFVRAG